MLWVVLSFNSKSGKSRKTFSKLTLKINLWSEVDLEHWKGLTPEVEMTMSVLFFEENKIL